MDNNNKINSTNLCNALNSDLTTIIDSKTQTIKTKEVGTFGRFINWLTGRENKRLLSIVNTYIKILEGIGTEGNTDDADQNALNSLAIKADGVMLKIKPGSQKDKLEKQMRRMETAAFYKLNPKTKVNEDEEASQERLNKLATWATDFKKDPKLFKGDEITPTAFDMRALKQASRYNDFYGLLKDDENLRIAFFKWTLRDGNSAKTFILFPQLADRISACALSPRYGHFHRQYQERKSTGTLPEGCVNPLKIKKENNKYKVMGSFTGARTKDGKDGISGTANLLNGKSEVNMGTKEHQLMVSVDQIFKAFQGKRKDIVGDFEMLNGAIHNWNGQEFGSIQSNNEYTDIKFEGDWWNQMPAFETLSINEAKAKFGGDLDGTKWGVYAVGARDSKKIDFGGNHAYKMILIPTGDGKYNVYPLGTFTKEFPQGLAMLAFLLNSVEADLRFDENVYRSDREKGGVLFEMHPETGKEYMDLISRKLRMSLTREKDSVFNGNGGRTDYTGKFIARRLREMDQYLNLLIGKDLIKNIAIGDKYKTALENLYKSPKIDETKLKEIVHNIINEHIIPNDSQKKSLPKNFERKIREDHERLHFHLNQTKYMFQFTDKNCAWNVQEELEEILGKESEGGIVPDLFTVDLTETQPSNFLKYFVSFAKALPGPLGRAVVRTGCRILGAGRSFQYGDDKKHKQSVKDTSFWKTAKIKSPAYLTQKVKDGKIKTVFAATI